MARFNFNGIDDLDVSFTQLAHMNEDSAKKIVLAGAEVVKKVQKEYLDVHHSKSGKLSGSIQINFLCPREAYVQPAGKHHGSYSSTKGTHRPKTGQGTSHKRRHHRLSKGVSSVDVGYYLEHGTPRMPAYHWMENANKEAEPECHAAMYAAWNEYVSSCGL